MNKIAPGLALATISSLTFLAYQHPTAYQTLLPYLSIGLACLSLGAAIWNSGLSAAYSKMLKYTKFEARKAIDDAICSVRVPIIGFASVLVLIIYLEFLWFLPKLLAEH
jgi:hypothetical protein